MTTRASRAVVTPVACVRPPAVAAAAVFDRLPATPAGHRRDRWRGSPLRSPRGRLSASMRYPPRAAKERAALSPSRRGRRGQELHRYPATHSSSRTPAHSADQVRGARSEPLDRRDTGTVPVELRSRPRCSTRRRGSGPTAPAAQSCAESEQHSQGECRRERGRQVPPHEDAASAARRCVRGRPRTPPRRRPCSRYLTDDDQHGQPEDEAGDDRFAQELGDPTDSQEAEDDQHDPCTQRQCHCVGTASASVSGDRLATSDPLRTDTVDTGPTTSWRDVPNSAYSSNAAGRRTARPWAPPPAMRCVAQRLGNGEGRYECPRGEVTAQPLPLVATQPGRGSHLAFTVRSLHRSEHWRCPPAA